MHFYAISYNGLMELPMGVFWEMARSIDRIRAEEDIRLSRLLGSMFGKDSNDYFDGLKEDLGNIVDCEEGKGYDAEGMHRLRMMMGV